MIKFNFEEEKEKELTFGDVPNNGFFVNYAGQLCQKVNPYCNIIIADKGGDPHANWTGFVDGDIPIQRIIGLPSKIEF